MRIVLRVLAFLVALAIVVIGLQMIAAESGEVVVLQTHDEAGKPKETRLWIVDEDGKQWLRAGNPSASWLLAIQNNPAVTVERAGRTARYAAVPDVASRDRINRLFASKYGWADAYIGALFGRDGATPIRLDPITP